MEFSARVQNPKQEGTAFWDCKPQIGPCPMNCNECFHNRPGAFYLPIDKPYIPDPKEVKDEIVRFNCGHDSNIRRSKVVETAKQYEHFFFNTALPSLNFPGPVVLTANREEEKDPGLLPGDVGAPDNLMFVRLRVSSTNTRFIDAAIIEWTGVQVPVVLTFMAYYTDRPARIDPDHGIPIEEAYVWKKRHVNSYWCPTPAFTLAVMQRYEGNRLVTMCGSHDSNYCKDCLNCESYYRQALKRLKTA